MTNTGLTPTGLGDNERNPAVESSSLAAKQTVDADTVVHIPRDYSMVVASPYTVNGTVELDGTLGVY